MMDIHAIRLRGPWTRESDTLGRSRRVFHCPTGLEPHETVFLVIEKLEFTGLVTLNQETLGSVEPSGAEFDITNLLQEQNELFVSSRTPGSFPGKIPGEVRLEIRSGGP